MIYFKWGYVLITLNAVLPDPAPNSRIELKRLTLILFSISLNSV